MQNRLKQSKPSTPKVRKPSRIINWLDGIIPIQRWIGNEFPVRYLGYAIWLVFLGIALIGVEHNAERQIRKIQKMKEEIGNLKAKYSIDKADFMRQQQQSVIAPKLAKIGLVESTVAPSKITINEKVK